MPVIYVYALSDFTTTIPNEAGAQAAGSPPFTVTTGASLTRIAVEINDNDANFDEIDGNQRLTDAITIDGVTYADNARIFGNYRLSNGTDPDLISVSAIGNNGGGNTTHFVATTIPLEPNTTYVYTAESNFNGNSEPYANFVCFVSETLIETKSGEVSVEELQVGDFVITMDNGQQAIRWIGSRTLDSIDLVTHPNLRPIRIRAGALAPGLPHRDLLVSPQHRVLVRSIVAQRMFGVLEVLVPAKKLLDLDGVDIETDAMSVTYHHFLFDRHEVVFSNGAPTESLFTGREALKSVGSSARKEIAELFPEIPMDNFDPRPARLVPKKGKMMLQMARRLKKNKKPVIEHRV